ncbi:MAG: hypothetical protein Q8K92_01990 [Leadbetterella sp.]|nr:hypothetical protein [Leadbetterella sp.]
MKNLTLSAIAVLLFFVVAPSQLKAASPTERISVTEAKTLVEPRATVLQARLDELKAMDKSDMSFSEKRQLRKETRSIKKEMAQINGGVYLSVGAIIIIVLLLILIL